MPSLHFNLHPKFSIFSNIVIIYGVKYTVYLHCVLYGSNADTATSDGSNADGSNADGSNADTATSDTNHLSGFCRWL